MASILDLTINYRSVDEQLYRHFGVAYGPYVYQYFSKVCSQIGFDFLTHLNISQRFHQTWDYPCLSNIRSAFLM